MTLTQLSYIVAVDKYRHFATAAQNIYITQPTLSMQIQKLEDELGVLIFDRSKTPVIPTPIGSQIIKQAKLILSGAKQIEDMVSISETNLTGTFRVGVIPTIAPYLIPLFLRNFTEKHPDVKIIFEEALTKKILSGLQEDYFDFGIIATSTTQHFLEEHLFLEPFLAYVYSEHPFAKKESLSVKDLDENELWLLTEGHCFRNQTLKICKQANIARQKQSVVFESGNLETLKRIVETDFGVTLLPYLALNTNDNTNCGNGVVKEFEDPVPTRKIRLVYSREYLRDGIISAFSDVIKASIPPELFEQKEEFILE